MTAFRRVAISAAVLMLAITALFYRGLVIPPGGTPFESGPVVVLGGGFDRVGLGLALVSDDPTRELVLSAAAGALYENAGGDCAERRVTCVEPDASTTLGEARMLADMQVTRGWEQVTVVTTDVHLRRAQLHVSDAWTYRPPSLSSGPRNSTVRSLGPCGRPAEPCGKRGHTSVEP